MEIGEHIRILDNEGHLLTEAAAAAGLDTPVPTCPGWRVRELLAHVHFVHRWAASYVAISITEMVPEPPEVQLFANAPDDERLLDSVREGHATLVRTLERAPADLRCWTFLPAPSPLAMWARRQAHETAIHRIDAEAAAGLSPTGFAPEFAVDGVDELLLGFFGRRNRPVRHRDESVHGTIFLEAIDHPQTWIVGLTAEGVEARPNTAPADLRLRATAADIYLTLWNRPPVSEPETSGNLGLLEEWQRRMRVTWA